MNTGVVHKYMEEELAILAGFFSEVIAERQTAP